VRAHLGGGSAGPYRGAKFSLFEGGIRVPAIISWPGHLPAGEVRHQTAHSCDWLPTVVELCDIPLVQKDIDGRSITDVIRSGKAASPHEVIHWTIGNSWAVRSGNWKLIGNPRDTSNKGPLGKDDKLFLVNLDRDKSEMTNLAGKHPGEVQRLKTLHDRWKSGLKQ
jgi:arylsulfatase A-like enzyme